MADGAPRGNAALHSRVHLGSAGCLPDKPATRWHRAGFGPPPHGIRERARKGSGNENGQARGGPGESRGLQEQGSTRSKARPLAALFPSRPFPHPSGPLPSPRDRLCPIFIMIDFPFESQLKNISFFFFKVYISVFLYID